MVFLVGLACYIDAKLVYEKLVKHPTTKTKVLSLISKGKT